MDAISSPVVVGTPVAQLVDSRGMGQILSCSPHHIERLAARRFIPSVKLGRLRRFRVTDVLAALERRTIKPWERK